MDIRRIKQVNLREVWPHEAYDFSTWLEANIDLLSDELIIGLDTESVRREQSAGAFSVDLTVDDELGQTVIIENQLSRSDHDHLGKVLTYAAAFESNTAIWIVGDPRPEHVKAATWLNDSSDLSIYMFKIQAIQIDESPIAPLLTLIVGPSDNSKNLVSTKREKTERHTKRRAFFTTLLEYAEEHTSLHQGRAAPDGPYLSTGTGHSGMHLTYGVGRNSTKIHLWIDKGKEAEEWTASIYQYFLQHKNTIEESYGGPLQWNVRRGEGRSRTIADVIEMGGWVDEDSWNKVVTETVGRMIKLDQALRPHFAKAVKFDVATD